jgi:hypothetical protein
VTLAFALRGEVPSTDAAAYLAAQIAGAIAGVVLAHLMFELPLLQLSVTERSGAGQWLAEAVATFGLLSTILGVGYRTPAAVPYAVGLYITSAYWFTSSTSFANPAVTIARSLSDPFAGIALGTFRLSSPLNSSGLLLPFCWQAGSGTEPLKRGASSRPDSLYNGASNSFSEMNRVSKSLPPGILCMSTRPAETNS